MLLLPLELLPELPEVLRLLPPLLLGAGGAQGRGAGAASPSSGGRGRGTGTGTSSSSGGSRFDTARCSTARCSGSKMRPDPAWAGLSRPHRAGGGRGQRPRGAPLFSGQVSGEHPCSVASCSFLRSLGGIALQLVHPSGCRDREDGSEARPVLGNAGETR